MLEEHGYRCEAGILYFAASRERARVALDQECGHDARGRQQS